MYTYLYSQNLIAMRQEDKTERLSDNHNIFNILTHRFPFQAEKLGPGCAGDTAKHGLAVSAEHREAGGGGQARDEDESPDQRHLCVLLSLHLPRRRGGPA